MATSCSKSVGEWKKNGKCARCYKLPETAHRRLSAVAMPFLEIHIAVESGLGWVALSTTIVSSCSITQLLTQKTHKQRNSITWSKTDYNAELQPEEGHSHFGWTIPLNSRSLCLVSGMTIQPGLSMMVP